MPTASCDFAVLGGGLAGLTIAREIARSGRSVAVFERDADVGGLARTFRADGFSFDLGGHRFHSNNPDVVGWLQDLMGPDLLRVTRRSRIRLDGRFIDYPLRLAQGISAFGPREAVSITTSYVTALVSRDTTEAVSFEHWVTRRFGRRLYDLYFRPYTEKVWGIGCHELAADWAAQRIGLPSLTQAVYRALVPARTVPATAVPEFFYPRSGYGAITDRLADEIVANGQTVMTNASVEEVRFADDEALIGVRGDDGAPATCRCRHVISTIPVGALLRALSHDAELAPLASSARLAYRGLVLIFLALDRARVSPDTWTYFPDPALIFGRAHEPKNWSSAMVPDRRVTSLALEVFCSPGEAPWTADDRALVDRTVGELEGIGWIRAREVRASWVIRVPCAYPIYSLDYRDQVARLRDALRRWPRLSLLGRTGSFQYLNADGVVEACFELASALGLRGDAVRPLPSDAGRWV